MSTRFFRATKRFKYLRPRKSSSSSSDDADASSGTTVADSGSSQTSDEAHTKSHRSLNKARSWATRTLKKSSPAEDELSNGTWINDFASMPSTPPKSATSSRPPSVENDAHKSELQELETAVQKIREESDVNEVAFENAKDDFTEQLRRLQDETAKKIDDIAKQNDEELARYGKQIESLQLEQKKEASAPTTAESKLEQAISRISQLEEALEEQKKATTDVETAVTQNRFAAIMARLETLQPPTIDGSGRRDHDDLFEAKLASATARIAELEESNEILRQEKGEVSKLSGPQDDSKVLELEEKIRKLEQKNAQMARKPKLEVNDRTEMKADLDLVKKALSVDYTKKPVDLSGLGKSAAGYALIQPLRAFLTSLKDHQISKADLGFGKDKYNSLQAFQSRLRAEYTNVFTLALANINFLTPLVGDLSILTEDIEWFDELPSNYRQRAQDHQDKLYKMSDGWSSLLAQHSDAFNLKVAELNKIIRRAGTAGQMVWAHMGNDLLMKDPFLCQPAYQGYDPSPLLVDKNGDIVQEASDGPVGYQGRSTTDSGRAAQSEAMNGSQNGVDADQMPQFQTRDGSEPVPPAAFANPSYDSESDQGNLFDGSKTDYDPESDQGNLFGDSKTHHDPYEMPQGYQANAAADPGNRSNGASFKDMTSYDDGRNGTGYGYQNHAQHGFDHSAYDHQSSAPRQPYESREALFEEQAREFRAQNAQRESQNSQNFNQGYSNAPNVPPGFEQPSNSQPQGYRPQGYQPQGYQPQGYQPQGYRPQGHRPSTAGQNTGGVFDNSPLMDDSLPEEYGYASQSTPQQPEPIGSGRPKPHYYQQ